MPAGTIRIDAPGPKAAILERSSPARVPIPKFSQALADSVRWSRAALTSAEGWRRAARSGIGGQALVASTIRGIVDVAPTRLAVKAATLLLTKGVGALINVGTPEAKRLHDAIGTLAGSAALVAESKLHLRVEEVGDIARRMRAIPALGVGVARALLQGSAVLMYRAGAMVLEATRRGVEARLEVMASTAGLAAAPTIRIGGQSVPGDGVIFTLPGMTQFTEPTSMIEGPGDAAIGGGDGVRVGVQLLARAVGGPAIAGQQLAALVGSAFDDLDSVRTSFADAAIAREVAFDRAMSAALLAAVDVGGPSQTPDTSQSPIFFATDAGVAPAPPLADVSEAVVLADTWDELPRISDAIVGDLVHGVAAGLEETLRETRRFSRDMAASAMGVASIEAPAIGLADALELDLMLAERAAGASASATRARQVIQMTSLALTAAIRAALAVARGIAFLTAGELVKASLSFAAAGLYSFSAGLAVSYGGGGGSRVSVEQQRREAPQGAVAELVVIVPGYADPARIRDEVAGAIDGTGGVGDGARGFAVRAPRVGSIAQQVFDIYTSYWQGDRGRNMAIGATIGLLVAGPIGYTVGALLGRYGGGEIARVGRRIGRGIRRIGRRLGF